MRGSRRDFVAGTAASIVAGAALHARAAPTSDGFTVLEAVSRTIQLADGPAELWHFGGGVPGPIIRCKHGEEVRVRLVNRLDTSLSLHWQGVRIVNAMDGVAGLTQAPVPPGATFDYRFTPPDSGVFLYRPDVHGAQINRLGAGLYGLLVVEEREPPIVEATYILAATSVQRGAAEARLVTGRIGVETAVLRQGALARLRVVNAAHATLLFLGIEGARATIVAIDSQPCEPFAPLHGSIPIGPGARFDIILELPGRANASAQVTLADPARKDAAPHSFLTLRTAEAVAPEHSSPAALPANPRLPTAIALERASRADLLLGPRPDAAGPRPRRTARRPVMVLAPWQDGDHPVLTVDRGTPVSFSLVNPSGRLMSVHIHGHTMRVLHDLDDGWHPYWRDTVLVEPGKTHHLAFIADNPGKWLITAQAIGMAVPTAELSGWFEVRV